MKGSYKPQKKKLLSRLQQEIQAVSDIVLAANKYAEDAEKEEYQDEKGWHYQKRDCIFRPSDSYRALARQRQKLLDCLHRYGLRCIDQVCDLDNLDQPNFREAKARGGIIAERLQHVD
jgi:hypothetical protein